jgi:hypothetical protein
VKRRNVVMDPYDGTPRRKPAKKAPDSPLTRSVIQAAEAVTAAIPQNKKNIAAQTRFNAAVAMLQDAVIKYHESSERMDELFPIGPKSMTVTEPIYIALLPDGTIPPTGIYSVGSAYPMGSSAVIRAEIQYVPAPATCATCELAQRLANAADIHLRQHGRDDDRKLDAALMAWKAANATKVKP